MNTAIIITLIICTTIAFFFTLGFLNAKENRSVRKKELEIKQMEVTSQMPKEIMELFIGGKKNESKNNDDSVYEPCEREN